MRKIVVAISGASGFKLGIKLFEAIPSNADIQKYLVVSEHAKVVAQAEEGVIFENHQIDAPISSGSFGVDTMIIVPCSMNTLSKIATGIADNLITRTASVLIKENKHLILAPREMPLSPIHLKNMLKLSKIRVIIAPPIIAYYSEIKTLEDMENFLIGKWLDLMQIENNLFKRWKINN